MPSDGPEDPHVLVWAGTITTIALLSAAFVFEVEGQWGTFRQVAIVVFVVVGASVSAWVGRHRRMTQRGSDGTCDRCRGDSP